MFFCPVACTTGCRAEIFINVFAVKTTYSASQLLDFARRVLGYTHSVEGAEIEQTEGLCVDTMLATALRQWYLDLLDNADERFIASDGTARGLCTAAPANGARVNFETGVRRVFRLQLDGWECEAEVLGPECLQ